ncbi:hypothetical protein PQQ84_32090 [Paraburkholderia strydomiana]|uniref:hypothetical protein n=1 Tax=Paraburkholderia strydomiana TaxID=1245417 RepID=UPI0038B9C433
MLSDSDIADEPVLIRLALFSLNRSGIVEAEAVIGQTRGIAVLDAEFPRELSQFTTLSATSSRVVSRPAYRLAGIGAIVEVRVQRLKGLPGPPGHETGDG